MSDKKYAVFKQLSFYYKLNMHNETLPYWYGSRISYKKYLKSPQWLRDLKFKKRPFWRIDKLQLNNIIENDAINAYGIDRLIESVVAFNWSLLLNGDPVIPTLTSSFSKLYSLTNLVISFLTLDTSSSVLVPLKKTIKIDV